MLPTLRGVIDRRILVNYRVNPAALDAVLPDRFSPHTVEGYAIGGICLIRLRDLRPRWGPRFVGAGSENAAHRIAVEVDGNEGERAVFVPRRDTNSRIVTLLGGRAFPGVHHHATFDVVEGDGRYAVEMQSDDGETHVRVDGRRTDTLPEGSVFDSVAAASRFFEAGSVGYSPDRSGAEYERLDLQTLEWEVTPLSVSNVASSYFDTMSTDAVAFDHALLMEDIDHEWHEGESLCSSPA
jgi:hypothetical protein